MPKVEELRCWFDFRSKQIDTSAASHKLGGSLSGDIRAQAAKTPGRGQRSETR